MLTQKQYELLLFIDQKLKDCGVSPSFEEMKKALDLRSKSGIHRLITGLEERGFIRRLPNRARALEVVRLPDNRILQGDFPAPPPPSLRAVSELKDNRAEYRSANDSESVSIPLYGKIAAGTPIEALSDSSQSLDIPASMLSGLGEHYALKVDGDSMIMAGILDGDYVVIRRCDTAENGAIVVALVDGQEATLKRLARKPGAVALEPANPNYETRVFPDQRVAIQGRLVGLIRRY